MNTRNIDWKLLSGIVLAYIFIYFSFDHTQVFWYLYTANILFLVSFSILNEKLDETSISLENLIWGLISGIFLYGIFYIGSSFLSLFPWNINYHIERLYTLFKMKWIWHYFVLILIIIPGEEVFWRGFIQKRISRHLTPFRAIMTTALLNSLPYCFTGYPLLIIAAFFSAIVWGWLYVWKRNIMLVIISHLIFDVLLIILFPLN
ncbi:CPBP family intramembrane glutamic endopeptidase [Lederbergia graminis]|uniref:CPBP family intramembrane glutamic endopeptidase n=1 Tax=Lederbergia graminis TaxID=735518 RepID=A0ABW0LE03_9BACI|nr:type II CAAX endopeptidase family protein [Paenibacillus bovis]HLU21849.1 type II CAAX endopeptidase family protein [Bacillaceae bacterium]